jgi:ferredoxin-NADP reductase
MHAILAQKTPLTETITSFAFKPEQPFEYTAGQFIELTLPALSGNNHRWFTVSSSPHEGVVTITTRVGLAAHTDFKRALADLQAGEAVTISEPMGDFVLPKLLQTPLIFVAGGIGITPFHSMLAWIKHADEERPIKMLYSVQTEDDIIFQDTFEDARQHVTIVVNHPSAAWGGVRGELTAEMILGLKEPSDDALIYVSGPEPFVQRLQKELVKAGVSNQQIVVDEFQGYNGI